VTPCNLADKYQNFAFVSVSTLKMEAVCYTKPLVPVLIHTSNAAYKSHKEVKGKVHPATGHGGPEEELRYSSTLSLTSARDGSGCLTPQPGSFTRERDPVLIVQEARSAPGPIWRGAEILALKEFDPRTVQPVVRHYTDYAIPAHSHKKTCSESHSPLLAHYCQVIVN
jgi:hypothetical protein